MRAIYYVMGILAAWIGSQMYRRGACLILALSLTGCRTYYVYQFGDRPGIYVDAKVDKDISPSVKASLQ